MKIKLDPGAFMPEYAHEQDAGMDLRSPVNAVVLPHDSAIIHTGIHVEIPHGYVGFLKSKSGLNVNHDITSEGVIDEGYTGSICFRPDILKRKIQHPLTATWMNCMTPPEKQECFPPAHPVM